MSTVATEIATLRSKLDRTIAVSLAAFMIGAAVLASHTAITPTRLQRIADPGLVTAAKSNPDGQIHIIVREANPSSETAERLVRSVGGRVTHELPIVGGFSAVLPAKALNPLARSRAVSHLWSDGRVHMNDMNMTKFDSMAPNTLWRSFIKLPSVSYDGTGVTVAVLDTGIVQSPDFDNRILAAVDFTHEADGVDHYGHGTHMAGIVAGNGSLSGGRWAGVAPGANLVSVKVAPTDGSTDVSVVMAGLQWVIQNKAQYNIRVMNLSFGTDSTQSYTVDPLDYAVEQVWNAGVLVVAASGNRGNNPGTVNKPGDDPYIVTVGAMDGRATLDKSDDVVMPFSSRGPTQDGLDKPDLVAPGVTLVSVRDAGSTVDTHHSDARIGTDYFKGTGTSQAAAVVSGVAALMFQARSSLTPNQAKALLMGSAMPYLDGQAGGEGLVNAYSATYWAYWNKSQFGKANVGLTPSTGTGSLEASRGSSHVYADLNGDGVPDLVQGEIDVRGLPWSANSWSASSWDANSWSANSWSANAWDSNSWDSNSWDSNSWDSNSWS